MNQNGLSESNVNWPKLREKINSPLFSHIKELIQKYSSEPGELNVLDQVSKQDFIDKYQKCYFTLYKRSVINERIL